MIDNDTQASTEPINDAKVAEGTAETVRDAEAVLRKNRELLEENARLKRQTRLPDDLDVEKARNALAELQRLEEEKLQKKGEYDKLIEQKSKAYEERLETERIQRQRMESMLKQEKLALTLIEQGVLPDRVNYLVKELSEQVDLDFDETGFVLKKRGGIGDVTEFNTLIEDVRTKSPFFFAANIVGGTGGSGSNSTGNVTLNKKWADLNGGEKAVAIREAGGDIELAKKKYK